MNLTPLRRRILAHLEQRGEMDIQEIGYEFSSNPRGMRDVFKTPQAATRFGSMLAAPLLRAGLIQEGTESFAYRQKLRITPSGRTALRKEPG
jgi:hypothetical protein